MKRAYFAVKESISRFVRWIISGVVFAIIALPVIASLSISE